MREVGSSNCSYLLRVIAGMAEAARRQKIAHWVDKWLSRRPNRRVQASVLRNLSDMAAILMAELYPMCDFLAWPSRVCSGLARAAVNLGLERVRVRL